MLKRAALAFAFVLGSLSPSLARADEGDDQGDDQGLDDQGLDEQGVDDQAAPPDDTYTYEAPPDYQNAPQAAPAPPPQADVYSQPRVYEQPRVVVRSYPRAGNWYFDPYAGWVWVQAAPVGYYPRYRYGHDYHPARPGYRFGRHGYRPGVRIGGGVHIGGHARMGFGRR